MVVWGYSPIGLAANSARDLGGRFAALALFGKAASGGNYAALSALTNIPATLLAGVFYELVFNDSTRSAYSTCLRVIPVAHADLSVSQPSTPNGNGT